MYKNSLAEMIYDSVPPNHLRDTKYLQSYLKSENKEPIPLALGETWKRAPDDLINNLKEAASFESGYQFSMYGLPSFRRFLKDYIEKSERIAGDNRLETAVTWNGTRSAMFDFGRYLLEQQKCHKKPVFISTDPGWDYEGVFCPLGYEIKKIPLSPLNRFEPCLEDFRIAIEDIKKQHDKFLSFLVINPQHNPTGNNWSELLVEGIIQLAANHKCGLLIDNAYYGLTPDTTNKTSALELINNNWSIIESAKIDNWIFATRSLGKQFHCNGWGIGAVMASPPALDIIVNEYRSVHSYNYNALMQKSMEKWMKSDESARFLTSLHYESGRKNKYINDFFQDKLNYPRSSYHIGVYSPYLLYEVPEKYHNEADSINTYIKELFFKTGVLVTDCWAAPRKSDLKGKSLKFVRMYTGVSEEILHEALERLRESGFSFR